MNLPAAMLPGLVQAAGVRDEAEARLLYDSGLRCLGFPLRLAHHAQDCTEAEAAHIVAGLPEDCAAVVITYETDPARAAALARATGAHGLQLHADVPPEALAALRRLAPELFLIKSLVIRPGQTAADILPGARALAPHADAFLTDTFDPATGAEGATGLVHEWGVSRALAQGLEKPLILAGGLTPDNVAEAVAAMRPARLAGVDAHTGLEGPDGAKDPGLCRRFVQEARRAMARSGRPFPPST